LQDDHPSYAQAEIRLAAKIRLPANVALAILDRYGQAGTKPDTKLKEHKNYIVPFRFCVPKSFAFFARL
jgi:hypothetical protein